MAYCKLPPPDVGTFWCAYISCVAVFVPQCRSFAENAFRSIVPRRRNAIKNRKKATQITLIRSPRTVPIREQSA
ncbi:hypothetical protein BDU57DRAFT_301006 [Ampelomyces quisqualis]|uniref:Uncharacterized protein n=1 Tax=Ampelomyces quisqualis TaxID=50730 RepID=A0A6A5QGN8_AMPQU|nr:hypothetical protein BDU57DRAFT_301006 [Ampelomyces quisqualis]